MSDIFAFDTQTDPILDQARANSIDSFDDLDATAGRGLAKGVGLGIMRGGAGAARAGGFAAAGLLANAEFGSSEEAPLDTSARAAAAPEALDPLFSGLDEYGNSAVDYWTPRPNEVGKVGQILGGLGEIVAPLAAGGPAALIATQELGRAVDLSRAGVDAPRSVAGGVLSGAATATGFKIPILGRTLTSRLATGAAGNAAFGLASRTAEHALLADEYPEQAPPILDVASVTTDTLTGLLFGGLHHASEPAINPRLKPSEVDALLTARTAKSFGQETTPGAPDSITAEVGHQSALEEALTQLSRGEPVDVSESIGDHPSTFTDNGHIAESVELARTVAAEEPTDVPYARDSVQSEAAGAGDTYSVHEGTLTDEQLQAFEGLRSRVSADENVGGTGAGAAGESGSQDAGGHGEPLVVFRGGRGGPLTPEHFNLETLGKATGHPSSGLGVFFSKSEGEAARYGTVTSHLLDVRNPKVIQAENLPGFDSLAEASAYRQKLIDEGHDGMVIDASHLGGPVNYVAFNHGQVLKAPETIQTHTPPVSKLSMADAFSAKPEESSELPEVAALQFLANEKPNAPIYSGVDENGDPVRSNLSDVTEQIQREYQQDLKDVQAYNIAVQCFLGHGA